MAIRKIFASILCFIPLLVLVRCANPVTPQGGPKDIKPPQVLTCIPPNYSLHFDKKNIHITFDEFIQLKDPTTKVNVCPPLLPKNDYNLHGKTLVVHMDDSLRPNTTYSLSFGDAILDITENNVLRDFSYVFSTGSYLDSLSLNGTVTDAFTLAPQGNVYAMLYFHSPSDTLPLDSLPFHSSPYYRVRTDSTGKYAFNHIRNADYLLVGLKDLNGNSFYDMTKEKIAFFDSLVKGAYLPPAKKDTTRADSLKKPDTLFLEKNPVPQYSLRMFEAIDSTQKLLKSSLASKGQVRLQFRFPTYKPEFIPLNFQQAGGWMIPEFSPNKDTVTLWLKSIPKDSLVMVVKDRGFADDTVTIDLNPNRNVKKSSKKEEKKVDRISVASNIQSGRLNQFRSQPELVFSSPLSHMDISGIKIIEGKDTIHPKILFLDSIHRRIKILSKWKEEKNYKMIIPDSALVSYNGLANDSITIVFKTFNERDFGNFILDLTSFHFDKGQLLIQLTTDKDVKVRESILGTPGKIKFDYLNPGIYKVRVIMDRNGNGRWDTGNFRKHIQPEEVFNFSKSVEIRANWDVEEQWAH